MKLRKQLKKLQEYLDAEVRERRNHSDDLKRLLHRMRCKEKELIEQALDESDPGEAARLRRKIELLHAQRRKGVKALQELGEESG